MNQVIVVCILCAVLSSSLLENAGAQTRNQHDSWSFIQSMERLSNVVENLQTKIELQASVLNNLATKSDIQTLESSLKNLEGKVEMHENLLNSLEAKLDALAILVTNLNAKEEQQVSSLNNLVGQSRLQSTLLEKMEDKIEIQSTSLNTLVNKEEWQQPVPLNTTNQTIKALQGDNVEIWCVVHGTPSPEIKWTRENGTLASNRMEYGNDGMALRIKNVNLSDEGTYVCVATNGVGSPASQSVSLEVQGPTGLFAATTTGLIALDLRTLKATALTSERTDAVAVNHKLKKVYWSEIEGNSRIMRSNFDGSSKEMIVPQTGDAIYMLAIDGPSGNVYFALWSSNEITVCNALGQNRATVISNSSLVKYSVGFALDSDNSVMYWGGGGSRNSLVRANLNGSSALIMATGFPNLYGITRDHFSNGVLYWADYEANTIGTFDVNGGGKQTLVKLGYAPYGIQVDAHKIYISNPHGRSIHSVDKGSGKELTTIFNSTGIVRQLALFDLPT